MASFAILSKEVSDPRRMLGPASPSLPPPPPHAPTTAQGLAVGLLPFGLPYRYCTGHPRQPRLPRLPRRDAGPHPPFINTTPAAASRACHRRCRPSWSSASSSARTQATGPSQAGWWTLARRCGGVHNMKTCPFSLQTFVQFRPKPSVNSF